MSKSIDLLGVIDEVIGTVPPISNDHCEWIDRLRAARSAAENLLDAATSAQGAFDALRLIGADAHLPGFNRCEQWLKSAISAAQGGAG